MVLAWGGNYLFVRVGIAYAPPLWLATLRASVGAAGVGAYLAIRPGTSRFTRRDGRDAMLLGLPNTAIFLGLWFVAAAYVPAGQAAVLIYTFPLWVALLSPAIVGRNLSRGHWAAIAIGFGGVVLVSEPWSSSPGSGGLWPTAALLAAAISWALATLAFQRRFLPEDLAVANAYQLLGGAIALFAASLVEHQAEFVSSSPALWLSVAWLGLFGTSFAYGVWFYLLKARPAATVSAYAFLVPLAALGLSVGLAGERLAPGQGVGVALVLVGLYLVGRGPQVRSKIRGA